MTVSLLIHYRVCSFLPRQPGENGIPIIMTKEKAHISNSVVNRFICVLFRFFIVSVIAATSYLTFLPYAVFYV